jgi:hypothetical protein
MSDEIMHDDDNAVKFIQNYLPQELKEKFSDDDIFYIIDLVYDFYDVSGFLDGADDATVEIDEEQLILYVENNAKKDGLKHFEPDEIAILVQGELEYCDSIHLFE